jgi:aspartyl-tRNA(Asn)/glutamyl-tRNA(Gln) amidotransferase subunit C
MAGHHAFDLPTEKPPWVPMTLKQRHSLANRAPTMDPMSADSSGARLSRADVVHVAKLARLALSDAEIDQYTADLAAVLEHAQDVAALDTAGVNQTAHPLPLANVYRVDEVRPSADRDEVLAMAPASENDRFRVPQILGDAP